MYRVIILPRAEKDVRGLDRGTRTRVLAALTALANEPRPPGCLKVKTEKDVWRIRIGDYRAAYRIDDEAKMVTVIRVGHRRDFYQ